VDILEEWVLDELLNAEEDRMQDGDVDAQMILDENGLLSYERLLQAGVIQDTPDDAEDKAYSCLQITVLHHDKVS